MYHDNRQTDASEALTCDYAGLLSGLLLAD